jgi:hypothetical protein
MMFWLAFIIAYLIGCVGIAKLLKFALRRQGWTDE